MSRFLRYRYAAFLGWPLLVIGSLFATIAVIDGIQSDPIRMTLRWAALAITLFIGARIQSWMLHRADPSGELRAELRRMRSGRPRLGEGWRRAPRGACLTSRHSAPGQFRTTVAVLSADVRTVA